MPARDRVEVTRDMVDNALGANKFAIAGGIKEQLTRELTKILNPPAWTVDTVNGVPCVRYRNTNLRLDVFTSNASPINSVTRSAVAELIAGVLNERGVEITAL